ncbi:cation:proton antiporter [Sphingomicrobium astaxanthinifaciens]|uniref:cation:proton antiporter domain-containing protein n=1 Tax=Sphingomicrobium astaxanthinifaciens TaxID=1227949 RepID=UPI001FCC6863|nr:cation:proton antiporter [Sphingomicrobium astaxanthinifaciens]MCJ7420532.1 cation:proton antiporter [Sphingomicrobium astaxanthinifaciens]
MEAHAHIPHLREVLLFLATAGIVVPMLQRRISPVLGYFIVGGLIGPFGLGLLAGEFDALQWLVIDDLEGVTALAELGVIFLLFVIGLELSFARLWSMRRLVFGLGSAQIIATGAVIAIIAMSWGNPLATSIILGACLALSSTAIVTEILVSRGQLGSTSGRATFSILLMQDLAVVPILFAVSILGALAVDNLLIGLGIALGEALLTILVIYLVGRLAIRPLLRLVADTHSREAFVAAILLIAVGTAALSGVAGLSMALGAFLAGLLIAETEFRHQVKVDIEPFKGLMLGLFFMSVGMGIDWRWVIENPFWIFASAVGLVLLKVAVICPIAILWKLPRARAIEVAILLGQAGEFGFLIIGLSTSVGLLDAEVGQFMLIVVGITMLATPGLAWLSRVVGLKLEHRDDYHDAAERITLPSHLEGHVLIAGFGRVGRHVAEVLDEHDIAYVAIEKDAASVRRSDTGPMVHVGDAARVDFLKEVGLDRAGAIVVTLGDPEASEALVEQIRQIAPGLPIFARARTAADAEALLAKGAHTAVPETFEGSLRLAMRVLSEYGRDEPTLERWMAGQRAD